MDKRKGPRKPLPVLPEGTPPIHIEKHSGLVWALVNRLNIPARVDRRDLVQEGMLQLIRAAQLYDPSLGATWATYAWKCALGGVLRTRRNYRCVGTIPEYVQRKFYRIARADPHATTGEVSQALEEERFRDKGGPPAPNTSKQQWDSPIYFAWRYGEDSLSRTVHSRRGSGTTNEQTLADTIPDPGPSLEEDLLLEDRARFAARLVAETDLTEIEEDIIRRRYFQEPEETLKEIGVSYGLSRERIRQLEAGALGKMRTLGTRILKSEE